MYTYIHYIHTYIQMCMYIYTHTYMTARAIYAKEAAVQGHLVYMYVHIHTYIRLRVSIKQKPAVRAIRAHTCVRIHAHA